jgi:hypothetical protein
MRVIKVKRVLLAAISFPVISTLITGCATTNDKPVQAMGSAGQPNHYAKYYRTPDKRKICIGTSQVGEGGLVFKEPHIEKCWLASGFDFKGYEVLYIAPTVSAAKVAQGDEVLESVAGDDLVVMMKDKLDKIGVFPHVDVEEPPPNLKILRLTNTVVVYSRGNYAGRFLAGPFGGGQPVFRVEGVATDNGRLVFTYTIQRSGTSMDARMDTPLIRNPGSITLEKIQLQDIYSMSLDLTDFMAAIAGKYVPAN